MHPVHNSILARLSATCLWQSWNEPLGVMLNGRKEYST